MYVCMYVCMYNTYAYTIDSFIHLPISRHLGCFYVFAIVNNAARNNVVQLSFWVSIFISFGYSLRSGVAELYGQFSSVQSLSRVRLFATSWITAHQASLSITNSQSSLKLTSVKPVMPSSHLILCRPLLLLPPIHNIYMYQISHCTL